MVQGGKYVTKAMIDKIQEALKDYPVELTPSGRKESAY